jgi:hypothetical protein
VAFFSVFLHLLPLCTMLPFQITNFHIQVQCSRRLNGSVLVSVVCMALLEILLMRFAHT